MAKIIAFPISNSVKELPIEVKECLYEIGRVYMKTLYHTLSIMSSEEPSEEELTEIRELVEDAYAKGLYQALTEYEEKL